MRSHVNDGHSTCSSPLAQVVVSPASPALYATGPGSSFAALAGVAGVLAAGLLREDLQAHLPLARVGEQPPASTPASLLVQTGGNAPLVASTDCSIRDGAAISPAVA